MKPTRAPVGVLATPTLLSKPSVWGSTPHSPHLAASDAELATNAAQPPQQSSSLSPKRPISALPDDLYAPPYTIANRLTEEAHRLLQQAYDEAVRLTTSGVSLPPAPAAPAAPAGQVYVQTALLRSAAEAEGMPSTIVKAAFQNIATHVLVQKPLSIGTIAMAMLRPLWAHMEVARQSDALRQSQDKVGTELAMLRVDQEGRHGSNARLLREYYQRREQMATVISQSNFSNSVSLEQLLREYLGRCLSDTRASLHSSIKTASLSLRTLSKELERCRVGADAWILYHLMIKLTFTGVSLTPDERQRLLGQGAHQQRPQPHKDILDKFVALRKTTSTPFVSYDTYHNYEQLEEAILLLELYQQALEPLVSTAVASTALEHTDGEPPDRVLQQHSALLDAVEEPSVADFMDPSFMQALLKNPTALSSSLGIVAADMADLSNLSSATAASTVIAVGDTLNAPSHQSNAMNATSGKSPISRKRSTTSTAASQDNTELTKQSRTQPTQTIESQTEELRLQRQEAVLHLNELTRLLKTEPLARTTRIFPTDSLANAIKKLIGVRHMSRATHVTFQQFLEFKGKATSPQFYGLEFAKRTATILQSALARLQTRLQQRVSGTDGVANAFGEATFQVQSELEQTMLSIQQYGRLVDAMETAKARILESETAPSAAARQVAVSATTLVANVATVATVATVSEQPLDTIKSMDATESTALSKEATSGGQPDAPIAKAVDNRASNPHLIASLVPDIATRDKYTSELQRSLLDGFLPRAKMIEAQLLAFDISTISSVTVGELCAQFSNMIKGKESIVKLQNEMVWLYTSHEKQLQNLLYRCFGSIFHMYTSYGHTLPFDPRFVSALETFSMEEVAASAIESRQLSRTQVVVPSFTAIELELSNAESTLVRMNESLDDRCGKLAELRQQIEWLLRGLDEQEARLKFYDWNTPSNEMAPSQRMYMILQPLRALKHSIGTTVHGRTHILDADNLEAQFAQAVESFERMCVEHLPKVRQQLDLARQAANILCSKVFGSAVYEASRDWGNSRNSDNLHNLYSLMQVVTNLSALGSGLNSERLMRKRLKLQDRLNSIVQTFRERGLPSYYYTHMELAVKSILAGNDAQSIVSEIKPPDHPYVDSEDAFRTATMQIVAQLRLVVTTLANKAKEPLPLAQTSTTHTLEQAYQQRNSLRSQYVNTLRFYEAVDQIVAQSFAKEDFEKEEVEEEENEAMALKPLPDSANATDSTVAEDRPLRQRLSLAISRLRTRLRNSAQLGEVQRAMELLTQIHDAYQTYLGVPSVDMRSETQTALFDTYFREVEATRTSSRIQKFARLSQIKDQFAVLVTSYENRMKTNVLAVLKPEGSGRRKPAPPPATQEAAQRLLAQHSQTVVMMIDLYKDLLLQYVEGAFNPYTGDAIERRLLQKIGLLEALPFFQGTRALLRDTQKDVEKLRDSQTLAMEAARLQELPYLSDEAPAFPLVPYTPYTPERAAQDGQELLSGLLTRVLGTGSSSALRRCYDAINRISTLANLVSLTRLRTQAAVRFRNPEVVVNALQSAFEYADEALLVSQFVQDTAFKVCGEIDDFSKRQQRPSYDSWMARLGHYANTLKMSREALPSASLLYEEYRQLEELFERALVQDRMDVVATLAPTVTEGLEAHDAHAVGVDAIAMDLTDDSTNAANPGHVATAAAQDDSDAYRSLRLFDQWESMDAERMAQASPLVEDLVRKLQGHVPVDALQEIRSELEAHETRRREITLKERASSDTSLLIAWRDQLELVTERLILNALESALGASQSAHSSMVILLYMLQAVDTSADKVVQQAIVAIDELYSGKLAAFVAFERDAAAYELRMAQESPRGLDMGELGELGELGGLGGLGGLGELKSYASASALLQRQDLARMLQSEVDGGVDPSGTLHDMGLPSVLLDEETQTMIDVARFDALLDSDTEDLTQALQTTSLLTELRESFPVVEAATRNAATVVTPTRASDGTPLTQEIREACFNVLSELREGEFILARISTQESFDVKTIVPYMCDALADLIDQIASIDMVRWRHRDLVAYLDELLQEVHQRVTTELMDSSEALPSTEDQLDPLHMSNASPFLNGITTAGPTDALFEESLTDDEEGQDGTEGRDHTSPSFAPFASTSNLIAHPSGAMQAAAGIVHAPPAAAVDQPKSDANAQLIDAFFGIGGDDAKTKPMSANMSRFMDAGVASMLESSMKLHITPIAALAEYFNTANVLLRGDSLYNYMARVSRPLFSPFRAGCLHAISLEEAVQTAFVFAFLHNEAQHWRTKKLAVARQEGEDDDDEAESAAPSKAAGLGYESDSDDADKEDEAREHGNEDLDDELRDPSAYEDDRHMPSFLASCYNVQTFMEQSSRLVQRGNVALLFDAFEDMLTKNRHEFQPGVFKRLGKLPVDLLSARAPVRFVVRTPEAAADGDLTLLEIKTIIPPVADVPATRPFDTFKVDYSVQITVQRVAVTEVDKSYTERVQRMHAEGAPSAAHFPPVSTLYTTTVTDPSNAADPSTPSKSLPLLNKAVTVFGVAPMTVGGQVLNALLQEDMEGLSAKLQALLGSASAFTSIEMDESTVLQQVQAYILKTRKAFSMPTTYDGSDPGFANLSPFRRTKEPIRAQTTLQETEELILRLKRTELDDEPEAHNSSAKASNGTNGRRAGGRRLTAGEFAFPMLEPLRLQLHDLSASAASTNALLPVRSLKTELRGAFVLQPFLSQRTARLQSYLRQARLYGQAMLQATARSRRVQPAQPTRQSAYSFGVSGKFLGR